MGFVSNARRTRETSVTARNTLFCAELARCFARSDAVSPPAAIGCRLSREWESGFALPVIGFYQRILQSEHDARVSAFAPFDLRLKP